MGQLDQVTFDWKNERIRMVDTWIQIEATVSGADCG